MAASGPCMGLGLLGEGDCGAGSSHHGARPPRGGSVQASEPGGPEPSGSARQAAPQAAAAQAAAAGSPPRGSAAGAWRPVRRIAPLVKPARSLVVLVLVAVKVVAHTSHRTRRGSSWAAQMHALALTRKTPRSSSMPWMRQLSVPPS